MKPVFCYNVADKKNKEKLTGEEFVVDRLPESLKESLEKAEEVNIKQLNKTFRPIVWLTVFQYFAWFLSGYITVTVARMIIIEKTFKADSLFGQNLWVPITVVALALLGALIAVYLKRKQNEIAENPDNTEGLNTANDEALYLEAERYFKLPASAEDIEILSFEYKPKGEKNAINFEDFLISNIFKIYKQDESIFFINDYEKYEIKISEIRGVYAQKQRLSLWWLDNEPLSPRIAEKYQIKTTKDGNLKLKHIYRLEISKNGEDYCIYLPPHSLEIIENLTGIIPTE